MGYQVRYCEICGAVIRGKAYRVTIEGVTLTVCEKCYARIMARKAELEEKRRATRNVRLAGPATRRRSPRRPSLYDQYEIVEDYAERIRRARQKLGWSQAVLAQRVGEKENTIKRIESGRLTPPIDLARKLEKTLRIKLLEPVVDEPVSTSRNEDFTLTLGDIARIREK